MEVEDDGGGGCGGFEVGDGGERTRPELGGALASNEVLEVVAGDGVRLVAAFSGGEEEEGEEKRIGKKMKGKKRKRKRRERENVMVIGDGRGN